MFQRERIKHIKLRQLFNDHAPVVIIQDFYQDFSSDFERSDPSINCFIKRGNRAHFDLDFG